jgi:hypothetical protein
MKIRAGLVRGAAVGILDHPRQVVVWAFPGFAPEEVLGVRIDEETLRVFVLESFPRADVDNIVKELRQSPR